jgi:hypothetical protein
MTQQKWTYTAHTSALADTGDHESHVEFTNGKDVLMACGDEMDDDDLQAFCDLLSKMPDLWSVREDATDFERCQLIEEVKHLKDALVRITHAKLIHRKGIATNALKLDAELFPLSNKP